jgi:hypothetical protein
MDTILNKIKDIFEDTPEIGIDFACSNIARLARLPGSFNRNRRKYNLAIEEVKILYYKVEDSIVMNQILEIGNKNIQEKQTQIQKAKKKLQIL